MILECSGVLISGAQSSTTATKKVELFSLESKTSCNLPDLPLDRWSHTSVGGVICGGENTEVQSTCTDISSGSWSSTNYQPISPRDRHLAWNMEPGKFYMLIGGGSDTSDIVYGNGTNEQGFPLQYSIG